MTATLLFSFLLLFSVAVSAEEMTLDAAWNAVKSYRYGDDFKPLLTVEKAVEASAASPEAKAKTAARLASLLSADTTPAGRQFVFMQLRLVGGAAEVPKIAEYLDKNEDRENARMALADIPGDESLVPLRNALKTFEGLPLTGVIGSLASRGDKASIPEFVRLLDSKDRTVAASAAVALGRFGAEGLAALRSKWDALPKHVVGAALIDVAGELSDENKKTEAKEIYALLSADGMPRGIRRAALEGSLRLLDDSERKTTITTWFLADDPEKSVIAAARLKELPAPQFEELLKKMDSAGPRGRTVLLEIASERNAEDLRGTLVKSAGSSDLVERVTAIRALGKLRDASTIPLLLQALGGDGETRRAARESLLRFDGKQVGPKFVEMLNDPAQRNTAIDLIVARKYYDAVDPMLKLARQEDETVFEPVVDGLARLCDPDEHDLPRLLDLYLSSRPGRHRDRVERAVVVVCEKQADANKRADTLLDVLAERSGGISDDILVQTLPLLGKVGNRRVADLLRPCLESDKPELKQAAVRALCNWPNADYSNELWTIVTKDASPQYRQWALRAFIRVVTLKNDRPESETLALLKNAMSKAETEADKQFCLGRSSAIRTPASVDWAASFLDDPVLAQTACRAIVELAHHRFLREPNKAKFEPILLKVEKIAKDKSVAERAQKSRMGM